MLLPNAPRDPEAFPSFLETATETLQLDTKDRATIERIGAPAVAEWALSTLSGREVSFYYSEKAIGDGLPEAMVPMLARVDYRGAHVVDYEAGELTNRVDELYHSSIPEWRSRFKQFSRAAAVLALNVNDASSEHPPWSKWVNRMPQTMLLPDEQGQLGIRFSGRRSLFRSPSNISVEGPVESVTTYGPGLSGRYLAEALVGYAQDVTFVSGGRGAEFVNTWNYLDLKRSENQLDALRDSGELQQYLPPGVQAEDAHIPETHYYSGGIAAAKDSLPAADIVLMSSVHTAGMEECFAGIEGARETLREGGLFAIKAPNQSLAGEAGMDWLMPRATAYFGKPLKTGHCGWLPHYVDPTAYVNHRASFAIYQS